MGDQPLSRIAALAAAAVLLVVAGVRYMGSGAEGPAPSSPAVSIDGAAPGAGARKPGRPRRARGVYVHVAGEVRRPGVYRLAAGARGSAALRRAGGAAPRADLSAVNLAAPLSDGQQLVVPERGTAAAGAGEGASAGTPGAGAGTPEGPISLSQATPEELDTLDGIGETLAERIVEYREAHGGFRSLEELREVEGIGEKRFESLREAVEP